MTSLLTNCKRVHIGPKIEFHTHCINTTEVMRTNEQDSGDTSSKCKERLKNLYQTNYSYMRSFLWKGKRRDFPISDHFVELTVKKVNLFGKRKGERVELSEIFSNDLDGPQTIVVTGGPGYGKSTLCKKLAYDWAIDEPSVNYLKHFHIVIIIILRELGQKGVKEAVLKNICHSLELLDERKIQSKNKNILIIFDGFDEILDKNSNVKFIREESFDISVEMTIILTSRPEAAEDIKEDIKLRFSLQGFSREQQLNYITSMFSDNDTKRKHMLRKLEKNELCAEMDECPLMLHMLCCLHQDDDINNIEGITDLYIRIFSLISERYNRKNIKEHVFEQEKYFVREELIFRLGKLLHYCRSITSAVLKEHFPKEEE